MKDTTIYDDKTLQDLLRDVDSLAGSRRGKIVDLIDALRKFMQTPEDAATFAPMIKDYLDVWIKNDEHLIKMGTIVQRIISAESYQGGSGDLSDILSDSEKEQLQREAVAELKQDVKVVDTELAELEKVTEAKTKKSTGK
jgi:hypothetical protein